MDRLARSRCGPDAGAPGPLRCSRAGQLDLREPGQVTETGPDHITYDGGTGEVIVWDSTNALDAVLRAREWTPLSDVAPDGTRLLRGLFRLGRPGSGTYALTRELDDDDREVPPQLAAVLWAVDDAVAVALYDTAPLPAGATTRPRPALPSAAQALPFAEACARGGGRSAHSAAYGFRDGRFSHSTVRADGLQLHYAAAEPAPGDLPVGVRVLLPR